MTPKISAGLAANCRTSSATMVWLERLPESIAELASRWSLTLGSPFDGEEASCAWVAPAARADGSAAVLKLAMPHFEGEHEIDGLDFWAGSPTVRLLEADRSLQVMLLERCEPGTSLRALSESDQDFEIARLLRRLWRLPPPHHPFRPLSAMLAHWANEAMARRDEWRDRALVGEGLRLFGELSRSSSDDVVLATDLDAGNVLRADRERWLVIDPKPFVGDRAYDATQHLLNCRARLLRNPGDTIRRFADLLQIDHERVRLWTFARVAVEVSNAVTDCDDVALARALAP